MFNIGKNTAIKNLEKTGCTIGHIQQCISDKNKHEEPVYTYDGARVQKGTILLHTCQGDFTLKFDVENAWARAIEIID